MWEGQFIRYDTIRAAFLFFCGEVENSMYPAIFCIHAFMDQTFDDLPSLFGLFPFAGGIFSLVGEQTSDRL